MFWNKVSMFSIYDSHYANKCSESWCKILFRIRQRHFIQMHHCLNEKCNMPKLAPAGLHWFVRIIYQYIHKYTHIYLGMLKRILRVCFLRKQTGEKEPQDWRRAVGLIQGRETPAVLSTGRQSISWEKFVWVNNFGLDLILDIIAV